MINRIMAESNMPNLTPTTIDTMYDFYITGDEDTDTRNLKYLPKTTVNNNLGMP